MKKIVWFIIAIVIVIALVIGIGVMKKSGDTTPNNQGDQDNQENSGDVNAVGGDMQTLVNDPIEDIDLGTPL